MYNVAVETDNDGESESEEARAKLCAFSEPDQETEALGQDPHCPVRGGGCGWTRCGHFEGCGRRRLGRKRAQ